jgi:hypothetical protein
VIHKENAGLGMARNTGIENAAGAYICFFDSDDYVDKRMIEESFRLLQREHADIVVFGMNYVDDSGNVVHRSIPESDQIRFTGEDVRSSFLPCLIQKHTAGAKARNISFSACTCLFSMNTIKRCNWRFVSEREIIAEDLYSLIALYAHVECVAVLSEAFYYYCENGSSLTRRYRPDRFLQNKVFYEKITELCRACNHPPEIERCCMSPFLGNTIAAMKQEVSSGISGKEARIHLKQIVNDSLMQAVLKEKMKDYLEPKIRLLFGAMQHKNHLLCYALLWAEYKAKHFLLNKEK